MKSGRRKGTTLDRAGAELEDDRLPVRLPDTCGMSVTVDGNGEVTGVRGNRAHPGRGVACGKTARYADPIQSPDRLRVPLVRRASGEEASWDECSGSWSTAWRGRPATTSSP